MIRSASRQALRRIALGLALASSVLGSVRGNEPTGPDYARDIEPLLTKYCAGCHGAEEAEGGLLLDSFEGLAAGGKRGAAIAAGSSERSRLIRVLDGSATPKMPPEDNPAPTADEIALLAAWIDAGAKGPSGSATIELRVPRIDPVGAPRKPIHAVLFASDAKSLYLGEDFDVRQVGLGSRALLRTLPGDRSLVTALALSADGKRLVTAGGLPGVSGLAKIWNLDDGSLVREFSGHRDALYAAKLSPDGARMATAGYDQEIRIWDAATGELLRTLTGHNDAVYDLDFSDDGSLLASASGDRTVKLWRVADGARLDTFSQPLEEVYALAFAPRSRRLAAGGADNRIRIWQISDSAAEGSNLLLVSRFAHEGAILDLAFTASGDRLATSAEDGTVKLWNAETLEELRALEPQSDWPAALGFSPDGELIAVGRQDGALAVYRTSDGQPQPPAAPKLSRIEPRAIRPGESTLLRLSGENLAGVRKVVLTGQAPPFEVVDASGQPLASTAAYAPQGGETWLRIAVPGDLALGVAELRVETDGGGSGPEKLLVDELPVVVASETTGATSVALPAAIAGSLDSLGDADELEFDAAPGATIVCQAVARSLGSKANLLLTLADDTGRVVASGQELVDGAEPVLAFEPTRPGRYKLRITDTTIAGSPEHSYVVLAGALRLATSCYPLSVPPGESEIELVGYNLGELARVKLRGVEGEEIALPVERSKVRQLRPIKVLVGSANESRESEPNDDPAQATALTAPAAVNGRFWKDGSRDADLYRFSAKAGKSWIIETDAARRGAPTDTRIEVLAASGEPVARMLLQATRDSYVTFRGIDSMTQDVRLNNWEEMELNEYVYFNGEIGKLLRMPQGPDSGFLLYDRNGRRIAQFDTSPAAHPLDEPCYTVVPHPIGAKLPGNGLPVFTLYYANDDDGLRELGRDSRLTFTAPADGDYLVRVSDVQGHSSPRHAYRLTIRRPAPDFSVALEGGSTSVQPGGARELTLRATRVDGFDGEIAVSFENLPAGWSIAPTTIESGHWLAQTAVVAAPDAAAATEEAVKAIRVTATATLAGATVAKPVAGLAKLELAAPDKRVLVRLEPPEITIAPGGRATGRIVIDRHGVEGPINFAVDNLPHGVIVDNIGLNGVLIPEGQSEREIFFSARPWVPETSRPAHAIAQSAGGECSPPVRFVVRKAPETVARADEDESPSPKR